MLSLLLFCIGPYVESPSELSCSWIVLLGFPPAPSHSVVKQRETRELKAINSESLTQRSVHAGVASRSGHHCAQPVHRLLGVKGSARVSLYVYNTHSDVDTFIKVLQHGVPKL